MLHGVAPVTHGLLKASPFCKALYAILVLGYLSSYSDTLYHGLCITPRNLLPPNFWLWTAVTYFVVERNVIVLLADLACVHLCGSVLEPNWKGFELLVFLVVVNCSVALGSTLILLVSYFVVSDAELLFEINLQGMSGFLGGLLVAVKQIVPDSTILHTPAGRIKNTHLPILVFTGAGLLVVLQALRPTVVLMYPIGAYAGWIYLRYFQPHSNGSKGDMSDHFAFPSLFPSFVQGPIEKVSNGLYRVLVRVGLCTPSIRSLNMDTLQGVSISLPGTQPQDAERRRQKALRDLSARLNRAKEEDEGVVGGGGEGKEEWPSLLDEDEPTNNAPVHHNNHHHQPASPPSLAAADIPPSNPSTNNDNEPKLVLQTPTSEPET